MVKYKYDAWGQILEISGSNVSLGRLNPFKYKGYYYDTEIGMYYCKSRYYVPEWGRWLNADNVDFLVFTNLNGSNLFSYCYNNPIIFEDSNGYLPNWAKWLIGVTIIATLAVATVVTAGLAGVGVGSAFAVGFSGAAIGSGVSGLAVTVASSAFAGAVVSGTIGLVGGAIYGGISTGSIEGALDGAANGFMIGTITGAVSGAAKGTISYARTTPLIRSISQSEYNSIKLSGSFSSNGQMESKWFATSCKNARVWGNNFGQEKYVGIRVLKSSLKSNNVFYKSFLDNIGPAYCVDIPYINEIIESMWFF